MLNKFLGPISFTYPPLPPQALPHYKSRQGIFNHDPRPGLQIANSYFKDGHAGCRQQVFSREIVKDKVEEALLVLDGAYGLLVFDAFRSLLTQRSIFEKILEKIKATNPSWSDTQCLAEAFTNYQDEWWHYDLGDCLWASEMKIDWYFPSMEADLALL